MTVQRMITVLQSRLIGIVLIAVIIATVGTVTARNSTYNPILSKMTISESNNDYSPKTVLRVYLLTGNKTELTLIHRYLNTDSVEVIPVHGYSINNVYPKSVLLIDLDTVNVFGSHEILSLEKQFFDKGGTVILYSTRGVEPLKLQDELYRSVPSASESNLSNIINSNPGTYYYVFALKLAGSDGIPVYYSLYSNPQVTMGHSDIFKFISSVLLDDANI
ncbi:MAG: hypothetical protein GSR82_02385 [Desulfurococcales archaeon]|nr:hypothetical protein [Desulfurococcales archaeon]MEB3772510.1 hypothetical protein [Desulfurococcales archaeon]